MVMKDLDILLLLFGWLLCVFLLFVCLLLYYICSDITLLEKLGQQGGWISSFFCKFGCFILNAPRNQDTALTHASVLYGTSAAPPGRNAETNGRRGKK